MKQPGGVIRGDIQKASQDYVKKVRKFMRNQDFLKFPKVKKNL